MKLSFYKELVEREYSMVWIVFALILELLFGISIEYETDSPVYEMSEEEFSENEFVQDSEVIVEEEKASEGETGVTWKFGLSEEFIEDIECAFTEIGENPDYIESVEYVGTTETAFFCNRDYKVTFSKGKLFDSSWTHSRFYRITTQEYFDSEPEKVIYPREYLESIRFWKENANLEDIQWSVDGSGELQDPDNFVARLPNRENIEVAYKMNVSEFVEEIENDKVSAAKKYNGQWVEITGTITYISDYADLVGYYLWGERGSGKLNITCWVDGVDDIGLTIGEEVTFVGVVREVTTVNNTEIALCSVISK